MPNCSSISCTMRGTTTAGETAPSTAPITAASTRVMPSTYGANKINAKISQLAGTHAIITAGRPTFFRSAKFKESPALIRIMISAICRSSDEMDKMDASSQFSTYGPSTMPVSSIPIMRGRPHFWQIAAMPSPSKKINASDVNIIKILPDTLMYPKFIPTRKKLMLSAIRTSQKSSAL